MDFLSPMGKAIIGAIRPKTGDIILDVATGTGEPGLSIAKIATGGKVIGTDIAEGMLAVAREQAAKTGITNYETIATDASELPFADNYFDAGSCRRGIMFFPDMRRAAKEMARVLKPGGKVAATVWITPPANPWVLTIMGPIGEVLQLQPPPPGAPGMFRCAAPGLVEDIFREAGLKDIRSEEISGERDFLSEDFYWNYQNELGAPVIAAMRKASGEQREIIRSKVFENIKKLNPAGGVKLKYSARIISAEK